MAGKGVKHTHATVTKCGIRTYIEQNRLQSCDDYDVPYVADKCLEIKHCEQGSPEEIHVLICYAAPKGLPTRSEGTT